MNDVLVDVLKAVVAHATDQEPGADVWVLLNGQRCLPLAATVDVKRREVAGELSTILCDQAPLGELLLLGALEGPHRIPVRIGSRHCIRAVILRFQFWLAHFGVFTQMRFRFADDARRNKLWKADA